MSARGKRAAPVVEAVTTAPDLRHGRWQDVLADVTCDAVIVDAPYSERTHKGALGADDGRTEIGYSFWGAVEIDAFVSSWAPRLSCWMVSITDTDLAPLWRSSMEDAGLYAFPPLAILITGMGVRIMADGPASWTLNLCVARRRAKRLSTTPTAKGIWRSLPGGYTGAASPTMAGGRGKPSWLLDALVADYSDPGMLVCDPCAGWGSTLVAAQKLGRRAIGAEVDPDAYAIAARRVRGDEARPRPEQPSLFETRSVQ